MGLFVLRNNNFIDELNLPISFGAVHILRSAVMRRKGIKLRNVQMVLSHKHLCFRFLFGVPYRRTDFLKTKTLFFQNAELCLDYGPLYIIQICRYSD